MGEANHNPRSKQYQGPPIQTGLTVHPLFGHRIVPSAEWLAANEEAIKAAAEAGQPVSVPDEALVLEIWSAAMGVYQSNLVPQQHWSKAVGDVACVARRNYKEWKDEVDAKIEAEHNPAPPPIGVPSS